MGRATRWLRSLLGGGKKSGSGAPPPASDKKRWAFGRTFKEKDREGTERRPAAKAETERRGSYREAAVPARPMSSSADSDEQNKHAIAVAAATAAVAEAAVAAAQAAAAVVRLTSSGRCPSAGVKREDWAAVKIQSTFRGYLARRALRALRGLVKLQALVRGNIVRKQAAETLRCMQALVRVQARTRACRALRSESSRTNKSAILHPGPSTPEKYETAILVNALNSNRLLHLKRNSSKPVSVETVEQDKVHSSGWNWLDRWMEERYWDSRQTTAKSMMGSGIDDEKNAKILEVDPGKPQYYPKHKNNQLHSCSTFASDPNSHSFATVQDSPSKDSTTAQLSIPSPSSVDMQESLSFPLSAEAAELAESPRFYSASSRPGSSRRGPFTPSKSECSQSLFSGYSDYPNYMANTESSRAKVRSQSAPKQRPEFEKSGSAKRMSAHYGFGQQQGSSAATQRSSSLHTRFTNKAYPGSGRLDRLGMPLRM